MCHPDLLPEGQFGRDGCVIRHICLDRDKSEPWRTGCLLQEEGPGVSNAHQIHAGFLGGRSE